MAVGTPSPNAPDILLSAFTESIHQRGLGVSQDRLNEFLTGYTVLHRRFERALRGLIKSLNEYEKRRTDEGWSNGSAGSVSEPLDDFLDATYAAAELFEFYESDVPKVFKPPKPDANTYRSRLADLKRESCLVCNRCKHNHAFPQALEISVEGEVITGFVILRMSGNEARMSREIHREGEAFSYNWSIRRLLGNVLAADAAAAVLIGSIPERGQPQSSIHFTLPFLRLANEISQRSELSMPNEVRSPKIVINADANFVEIDENQNSRNDEKAQSIRAFVDLISQHLIVEFPYIGGSVTMQMSNQTAPGAPIPGYLRAVFQATLNEAQPDVHLAND